MPNDRPIGAQLMRPIFLVQVIFIGYMACSSIFYFLNLLGYMDNSGLATFTIDDDNLDLAAQCQRYYILGHAAFVTGMVLSMKYPIKHKYKVNTEKLANTLLTIAIIFLPLSYGEPHKWSDAILFSIFFFKFYCRHTGISIRNTVK
nr:hypothetical protein [Mucilaginibacter humi]